MSGNDIINLIFVKEDMKLSLIEEINKPFFKIAELVMKKFSINKESEEPYFIFHGTILDINSAQPLNFFKIINNSTIQVVCGAEVIGGNI